MSYELKQFHQYLGRLKELYFKGRASFAVFEAIIGSRAPNVVGEDEARMNADVIGENRHFFNTVEEATRRHALITFAKFFDNAKQVLVRNLMPRLLRSFTLIGHFFKIY